MKKILLAVFILLSSCNSKKTKCIYWESKDLKKKSFLKLNISNDKYKGLYISSFIEENGNEKYYLAQCENLEIDKSLNISFKLTCFMLISEFKKVEDFDNIKILNTNETPIELLYSIYYEGEFDNFNLTLNKRSYINDSFFEKIDFICTAPDGARINR